MRPAKYGKFPLFKTYEGVYNTENKIGLTRTILRIDKRGVRYLPGAEA